ncbi:MAG: hypothetical protein WC908_02585 [Candidatus Paceibacterota bacterium]
MNSILKNNKIWKIVLILTAIFFLWVSTFGLLYHIDEMKSEIEKNACLFSSSSNGGCAMNFSEHIAFWQEMTLSLPQNIIDAISALLLMIALVAVAIFYKDYIFEFFKNITFQFRLYIKEHPQINLFNYLKEVFSSGILNTKIYKLATI